MERFSSTSMTDKQLTAFGCAGRLFSSVFCRASLIGSWDVSSRTRFWPRCSDCKRSGKDLAFLAFRGTSSKRRFDACRKFCTRIRFALGSSSLDAWRFIGVFFFLFFGSHRKKRNGNILPKQITQKKPKKPPEKRGSFFCGHENRKQKNKEKKRCSKKHIRVIWLLCEISVSKNSRTHHKCEEFGEFPPDTLHDNLEEPSTDLELKEKSRNSSIPLATSATTPRSRTNSIHTRRQRRSRTKNRRSIQRTVASIANVDKFSFNLERRTRKRTSSDYLCFLPKAHFIKFLSRTTFATKSPNQSSSAKKLRIST